MKSVFLISALFTVSQAAGPVASMSFAEFQAAFKRDYASVKEAARRSEIYRANVAEIDSHNARFLRGLVSWYKGVNDFADLTHEEFAARFAPHELLDDMNETIRKSGNALPDSVDWVKAGAVTAVKNQGQCGSCWAFGAMANVEALTFIKTGVLPTLSEQQVMDCCVTCSVADPPPGPNPCSGGWGSRAIAWAQNGVTTEALYPYTANVSTCRTGLPVAATVNAAVRAASNSEEQLLTWIVDQPMTVSVMADDNFMFYQGGVMNSPCGTATNHAVLAVGYGVDTSNHLDPLPYYTLKNSWGPKWGEAGYIRIGRGPAFVPEGQCGVQKNVWTGVKE